MLPVAPGAVGTPAAHGPGWAGLFGNLVPATAGKLFGGTVQVALALAIEGPRGTDGVGVSWLTTVC